MNEYWQRSVVTGYAGEGKTVTETVLHRRGEDPIVMACRRNLELAGCGRLTTETMEAFQQSIGEDRQKTKDEIPHGGHQGEEWDW